MTGFGLAYLSLEGAPMHPDDSHWRSDYHMTDELYIKQGAGYLKATGDKADKIYWSRPELLPKIKELVT